MNKPTPAEIKALRKRYAVPVSNTNQLFRVYSCGKVVYENTYGLCDWYIKQHGLNTKPTLK